MVGWDVVSDGVQGVTVVDTEGGAVLWATVDVIEDGDVAGTNVISRLEEWDPLVWVS